MKKNKTDWNKLSNEEAHVILNKGTEMPFTGEYNNFNKQGVFLCNPLRESKSLFTIGRAIFSIEEH